MTCFHQSLRQGLDHGPARCLLLLTLATASWPAVADWEGFSRYPAVAEIEVQARNVLLDIRIKESAALEAVGPHVVPEQLAERLVLVTPNAGKLGKGSLVSFSTADLEPKTSGDPKAGPGARFYEVEYSYPLPENTERLSIAPATPAAQESIGLVLTHHGVPVCDLMALKRPARLLLNANDPWKSRLEDPDCVRRHSEPRSFLYVEPHEVRHEALLRVGVLGRFLDLGLPQGAAIGEDRQQAVKQQIGAFLQQRSPMRIDGTAVMPIVDRVEFVRFSRNGVQPLEGKGSVDARSALVGVILSYPTERSARRLRLSWDLFTSGSDRRSITVIQGRESFEMEVTPEQPVLEWTQEDAFQPAFEPSEPSVPAADSTAGMMAPTAKHQHPRWPFVAVASLLVLLTGRQWSRRLGHRNARLWLALGWTAAAAMSVPLLRPSSAASQSLLREEEVPGTVHALLDTVYRAFPVRSDAAAYDQLALSMDGELLEETYLQQRRVLLYQTAGMGGEGRVQRVEMLEASIESVLGADHRVASRWIAHGTVSHWGHSHDRRRVYQATLTLRPFEDGRWRIVAVDFSGPSDRVTPGRS